MSEATKADRPFPVLSSEGLGPNALTYARERVSLLGAGEHMDTVNRALDAMDGLPGAALLGGWTFKGFTAWAQGLESEIERLRAEVVELDALRDKLAGILSRTAVALRGPEPPLTRWSWHDLPERAAAAIAAIDLMQRTAQHLAAGRLHDSDCAMHNAPAYPAGECDCVALRPNAKAHLTL